MNNIVITGEGIVSAIGLDKAAVLTSLREQRSGVGEMRFLRSVHHELPVGEVKLSNEEMKALLEIDLSQTVSRTALMGMMAVHQALADARLEKKSENIRVVLINGTTVGGMDITEDQYHLLREGKGDLDVLRYHDCGSCTEQIADFFGCFDDSTTISTACSSAANALILGANLLKAGMADIVVAGGSEALTRFHLNGFNSLMILDKEVCRPFDAERAGLNLGEGAAFVVMETAEQAEKRGAEVHAYLRGYGNACDAFHQTASSDNGEGAYRAMSEALRMADLQPSDIQYVNAHGTGTPNNDSSESAALQRIFSESMPLVSSTKSFTGHTTSASGAIETVICLLAMRHRFVPANLGWKQQMEEGITPTLGIEPAELTNVMCNSFGFGGNDSSLLFSLLPAPEPKPLDIPAVKNIKVLSKVEINDKEQLKEIAQYVKPLEARRMGKLMKSSLLSSLKALEAAGIEKPDAIITATAYGCLENSERLLEQMEEEGEVMLKPTYFMQSTHNTISGNLAIRLSCHGYNVTYTQGRRSLDWALRDAELLLRSGQCKTVLVGCHDESTERFSELMKRAGMGELPEIQSIAMVVSCGD